MQRDLPQPPPATSFENAIAAGGLSEAELLHALLSSTPDLIYFKDCRGRFIQISRSVCATLRIAEPEDAIGRTDFDFYSARYAKQAFEAEQRIMATGEALVGFEEMETWPDGTRTWLSTTKVPLRGAGGAVIGIMGISRDVTDKKKAEEEAVRANESRLIFLANMSHEIRTPLNGVIGFSNLLLDTALDDEQKEFAEGVQSSSESLLSLVNEVLDFSKIEAGRIELESVEFPLRETVAKCLKLVSLQARQRGLELRSSVDPGCPEMVVGDVARVCQILLNLLSNAIKFTERGSVTAEVRPGREAAAGAVRFEVRDTGIGIDGDGIKKIFEPFTQADSSTTRRFGGTGLGLSISRALVDLMGGNFHVESVPGKGSTFAFEVPLPAAAVFAGAPEIARAAASGVGGDESASDMTRLALQVPLRILVADDNASNLKLCRFILKRLGYEADEAGDGREALRAVQERLYDVILMDVRMPVADGIAATRMIRNEVARARQPWIIALTANATVDTRARCLEAGMDDFLTKPIRTDALIAALRRARPAAAL